MIRLFPHCWSKNLQKHLRKILLIEHFPTIPKEHPQFPLKFSFDFIEFSTTKLLNIKYFLHYKSKHSETTSMRPSTCWRLWTTVPRMQGVILWWRSQLDKAKQTTNGQIVQHPVRPICIVNCCFGFKQSMGTFLSWPKFCEFDSKHKKQEEKPCITFFN
jgi:hypothetical protein